MVQAILATESSKDSLAKVFSELMELAAAGISGDAACDSTVKSADTFPRPMLCVDKSTYSPKLEGAGAPGSNFVFPEGGGGLLTQKWLILLFYRKFFACGGHYGPDFSFQEI